MGETPSWRRLIVGDSVAMSELCETIELVAPTRCTVLITGETGTGKEIVAKAIHLASKRASAPLVAINCTALPSTLIEAELFGHAKGAFTGAFAARIGRFEQANRGSLFLDEIGDLPIEAQAKLLRVLQDQEIQRLGAVETVRLDVRILAATNRDLEQDVAQSKFREDLYYRLNVVSLHVPALRDRREDISLLIQHFLEKNRVVENCRPKTIANDALEYLESLDWPGNVRQLEHAVQRAFVLSGERQHLTVRDFQSSGNRKSTSGRRNSSEPLVTVPKEGLDFDQVVSTFEKSLLQQALAICSGNKARAADLLQIKRTTLLAKLKSFELAESGGPVPVQVNTADGSMGAGSTALVVEHDASTRRAIAAALNGSGLKVFEASEFAAAAEILECWRDQLRLAVLGLPLAGIDQENIATFAARVPTILVCDDNSVPSHYARMPGVLCLERDSSSDDLLALANQITKPQSNQYCA